MPNAEHLTTQIRKPSTGTTDSCIILIGPIGEAFHRESLGLGRLFTLIRPKIVHVKREEGLIRGILH